MGADSWDKGRLRSIWIRTPAAAAAAAAGDLSPQQHQHHHSPPSEATGGDHHTGSPGSNLHHHPRHTHHDSSHASYSSNHPRLRSRSRSPGSPSKGPPIALLQAADTKKQQRPQFRGARDREVLANALACAGASMADPLMSMVDTYFSGKLGTTALAALGSNGALFSVMYFLCFTALAVLTVQAMATANSRGDAEGLGRGFLQSLAATAVVSTFLVVLLLSAPETVLSFFQTNAEVMPYAKTYLMIRTLSLPAALAMNVCQAAFRSLLDLTTPFAVVMTANAANALFDQLLMVGLGWGMAGCGWASVISQYIGALLFAAIIYRRRHKFGIPEALAGAADRWREAQEAAAAAAAAEAAAVGEAGGWHSGASSKQQHQQHGKQRQLLVQDTQHHQPGKQQHWWPWRWWQQSAATAAQQQHKHQQRQHAKRDGATARAASGSIKIHVGSPPHRATAGREHSGSLRINMSLLDQQQHSSREHSADVAGAVGIGGDADAGFGGAARVQRRQSSASAGGGDSRRVSMEFDGLAGLSANQQQQQQHEQVYERGRQSSRGGEGAGFAAFLGSMFSPKAVSAAAVPAAAASQAVVTVRKKKKGTTSFAPMQGAAGGLAANSGNSEPLLAGPAGRSAVSAVLPSAADSQMLGLSSSSASGSGGNLRRLDSVGSDSKLPRLHTLHSWQRLLLLLQGLDWRGFVRRFAGMTTRGLLILSTYSSASMVAAKAGTAMLAAHQVVQQQQQLQMSFAWSFLHVGQSMTANIFHAAAPGGGAKAARRLALRIIAWAVGICGALALLTYNSRHSLSGIFTADGSVRALVSSAGLPASLMLGLAWNNALEGCLLAADDQAYVVKVYPYAVGAALAQLARAQWWGLGLPGVWWGLATYYLVLLLGFAGRFWLYRGKI